MNHNQQRHTSCLQQQKISSIYAAAYVSESEIAAVYPDYQAEWEDSRPLFFKEILWNFGLNSNQDYSRQDAIPHRNKMNKVVTCSRWVGNERFDEEWLKSGFASQEAIDRSKNSGLLDSLYREKLMTTDTQDYLEAKDRSAAKISDEE